VWGPWEIQCVAGTAKSRESRLSYALTGHAVTFFTSSGRVELNLVGFERIVR